MRTSKYLNKTFGDWECVSVQIATRQAVHKMNHKGLAKRPGHCNYCYIFARRTSDDKADKMIRLTSSQAAKVFRGELTVEDVLNYKEAKKSTKFSKLVSYNFN